jgi:hypothetical protein
MNDKKRSLEERLKAHPSLRERFYQILSIAEDSEGNIEKADDAEQRVIDELRRLGQEVLEDWANRKEKQKAEELKNGLDGKAVGHGKKKSIGTQRSGK